MKKTTLFLCGIFAACIALICVPISHFYADDTLVIGDLTVHFIDVGQGDACVVALPDGRNMLIDAGKASYGKTVEKYINENIKDSDGNTIDCFDYVILTHSDSDHIGGMSYVLGKFDAKIVYRPNEECVYEKDGVVCHDHAYDGAENRNRFWGSTRGDKATATYHNTLEKVYEVADEVIVTNPYDNTQNTITSVSDKKYEIKFYSPLSPEYKDHNNYSPIIIIEYMGRKIVLTGDAEQQNEAEFVEKAREGEGKYEIFDKNFCADVIKLGHHGSRTSSSENYLDTVTNAAGRKNVLVVISCGLNNEYGHPHPEVLDRLRQMGFDEKKILRTDELGDIVITIALVDGQYKAVCLSGDFGSGGTGEAENTPSDDPIDQKINFFDSLDVKTKIVIIVVAVIVVIAIILAVYFITKRSGRRRR